MKSKYYTPEISEFHVGFEYEVLEKGQRHDSNIMYFMPPQEEDEWRKYTFPDPFLGYRLDKMFEQFEIRVKYLDRSDIELLGFSKLGKDYRGLLSSSELAKMDEEGNIIKIRWYWDMLQTERENLIRIFKGRKHVYPYTEIFRGDIKNINELKKLMKQLKIV